jgi:ABC-type transport system involved in cytochrome c biogenesis permease subunit
MKKVNAISYITLTVSFLLSLAYLFLFRWSSLAFDDLTPTHGKLLANLLIIIGHDMAPRASLGVFMFLDSLMPAVHRQLLCHVRMSRS